MIFDPEMDEIVVLGREEDRHSLQKLLARYDAPAYVRRARQVEDAFDLGAGWRLYQSQCGGFLTGVIPTAEVHVNIPLNHRGALDINDPIGAADTVDLTFGVTFVLGGRSTLALGYVTPVTGPRPFDYELLLQFNWRFGAVSGAPTGNILGM